MVVVVVGGCGWWCEGGGGWLGVGGGWVGGCGWWGVRRPWMCVQCEPFAQMIKSGVSL